MPLQPQPVRYLRSHWTRPLGPLGYYWFLTFEGNPEIRELAKGCQALIDFSYFDQVPLDSLHLTLGRIANVEKLSPAQLDSITSSARYLCRSTTSFGIEIPSMSSVPSAVALDVRPVDTVHDLRDTLRTAVSTACPHVSLRSPKPHPPHITICYANSDGISAADAMSAVENANHTIQSARVEVTEAKLVLLERRQRSYSWQVISRIPLARASTRTSSE
ncbi:2'-5' RNA ligase family protein [Nocardia nova]